MGSDAILVILSRWLHVVAGCLALGGVVVMRLILPAGLRLISDPQLQRSVFLRVRRSFKMLIHLAILIFLITGTYNAIVNWDAYRRAVPASHAFFGLHVLLAVVVMGIALWVTAGAEPPKSFARMMMVNLVLLLCVVAAASCLKYVRDQAMKKTAPASRMAAPTTSLIVS